MKRLTYLIFFITLIHSGQQSVAFHNSLTKEVLKKESEPVADLFRSGRFFNFSYPSTIWYNGKTFTAGQKDYLHNNNQLYAFEIQGSKVTKVLVGSGTSTPDFNNHPTPAVHIDNTGYLWVLQTDPHLAPISVYKSNSIGTIADGLSYQGQISINSSYISIVESDDTILKILTRSAGASSYSHRAIDVDLTNLAGATSYAITNTEYSTTSTRHYLGSVKVYGNATKHWVTINHRKDPEIKWYKHSAYYYLDEDDRTIYNLNGSYSKDTSVSPITATELENNSFSISGSDSDKTLDIRSSSAIQIGNDFYISQRTALNTWRIMKINEAGSFSYSTTISGDDALGKPIIDYNGYNLVLSKLEPNGLGYNLEIYTMSLDLSSGFVLSKTISVDNLYYPDFPINLPNVEGFYGIAVENTYGEFYWLNTFKKFK